MKSILYLLISLILSSYFSEYIHFDFLPGYDDIASNPVFADTVELNTDSGPALFFICVIDILFFYIKINLTAYIKSLNLNISKNYSY